jgi:hypothetical protein
MWDQYLGDVRVFDDGVLRPAGAGTNTSTAALGAGPSGTLFGLSGNSRTFYVMRVDASGIMQATPFFSLLRQYTTAFVYTAGRVFTDGGDVINVSNPDAPTWAGGFPFQGRVALRDAQTLLMLTTSNSFPVRTEVRIIAAGTGSQIGSVTVPSTIVPGGTYFSKLVYAGGDTVALVSYDYNDARRVAIIHDPSFGTPTGGTGGWGGTGGQGGSGGVGGTGGTGGTPVPCPGCSFVTVPAYGARLAHDAGRKLIYVSAHAQAASHPSSLVTVDTTTASVASIVPVGNDPQPLALSDDGSALWVGLAGEHRVRRMTPAPTPVPGLAYSLPTLLTTGEKSVPYSIVVLPGTAASLAVAVVGNIYGGRGVFILDDGQPRANFIQPPEVAAFFITNGPPGYLLGVGDTYNLALFRLGSVGVTYESFGGLLSGPSGLAYANGYLYASSGEVIDMSMPEDPYPVGQFAFSGCALAIRSSTRIMMLCPSQYQSGPVLRMLDTNTFTTVGSVALPDSLSQAAFADFAYLGGDAVALLPMDLPLQIMRAPLIGTP